MAKMHFVDPYTEQWWAARRGIPTASQFHRIITPGGKPSGQARGYMYELIAERLLNESTDRGAGNSPWVERGSDLEAEAIAAFGERKELVLQRVGFVTTDDGRIGASPDCLVKGSVEAVEIKVPAPWTHVGYLLDGPGADYKPQVQGHMLVGEFERVHFFSYHPRMPACYRLTVRDEAYLALMARLLDDFCVELEIETDRARAMGAYIPAQIGGPVTELPGKFPWKSASKS